MSDQNQWPKPGETPDGTASSVPSSAAQPDSGQPQQYGASAPEAPAAAPNDPWGQSGQQAHPGYGAPQGSNPYAAPQNPYAAPQQPQQPQNPYAAQQPQNPYGAPQQQNPYAAPQNPYAAPGQQNPYAAPGQQNPYAPAGYQPYAQRPKTNTLAILSIVFGLGAIPLFFMAILLGPAGAILGHLALGRIKQTGESGRALALTGVIAGWVMTGVWILWIIGLFAFASMGSSYSNYDDYGSGAFIG
ncbi:hypothetical protein J2X60_000859 [Curtobacterium sp. 320]|uniref:DUF4190 domain-containing protein n=1 Tax=Curtobacterium sp. 320 TaxID=2817749 RepID=UPI00285DE644|nr:DUF4190 domain-containing protein [Curtobacterium sp. 320]MDR6572223.1 hypothetical protein [Curtobacterium sp. 320]